MKKEEVVCNTMPELLMRLMSDSFGSKKYAAVLQRFRAGTLFVREYFDDGKGHSGAFSNEDTPVTEEVFQRAVAEHYIHGELKPGYVSTTSFIITDQGKWAYWEMMQLAEKARGHLFLTKGMRACDLHLRLEASEEAVQEALDELARLGYAEPSEHEGQKCYHRAIRTRSF